MRTLAKYRILLWLTLAGPLFLPAQTKQVAPDFNPVFEVFRLPGAGGENRVQSMVQDSLGFMWFGTTNGLIRYDGQNFVTHRHNPLNENSLASSYVESIFIDSKGLMWVGHYTLNYEKGGLTLFDPATEKCTRFYHQPDNPNSLADNHISAVAEDRQGYIWIATFKGLDRYDRKTGQFKHFTHRPDDSQSLSYDLVRALYVDKQGILWVGCGFPWDERDREGNLGGLNRYNPQTETFTRYLHNDDPNSLADNRVRALFEDSAGNFWVGTMGDGLQMLDRAKGTFTHFPYDPQYPERLSRPYLKQLPLREQHLSQVTFIREDQEGRIWVGAFNGGINVYDPKSRRMRHFERSNVPGSLLTNFVWNWCQSREGVDWIACGITGGMVMRVATEKKPFPFFGNSVLQADQEYFNTIMEDNAGNIWLGSGGSATPLIQFNRKSGAVQHYRYNPNPNGFSARETFCLLADKEGFVWAGTDSGLFKIHPVHGIVRHYTCIPGDAKSLSNPRVAKIVQDRNGLIWVATLGGGLNCLNPATGTFKHYVHDPANPGSIGGDYLLGLLKDRDGNLWIGGAHSTDGFNAEYFFADQLEMPAVRPRHFILKGEYSTLAFQMAESGNDIWITALPNGLRKLNKITGQITEYSTVKGNSPTDFILAIASDKTGNLWMTYENAILRFDPKLESFFTYSGEHGVQIENFCMGSYFINPAGEHFIAGETGFHVFLPEDLLRQQNTATPKIDITGFFLANKLILPGKNAVLQQPVWETEKILLSSNQNTFSFSLACFDFENPKGNQIEFQLEPYDPTWRTDLHGAQAAYYNVPPGEYVFRVRGASSKGVWTKEAASIRVVIRPPWQATWWAYLLYAALAMSIVYGIYRFLLHRRMVAAEAQRLKELDAVKNKLYTNITHEFRTPLTVISGMADQLRENPGERLDEGLNMIKRNSNRLLQLVNQMLDLAKLESGKMALHLSQGDIVNYLKYLVESFHSFAAGKGVQIHFLSDLEAFTMDYDPEKLQQIVTNLLSNAVKFTPANGHVYVDLRFTVDDLQLKKLPLTGPAGRHSAPANRQATDGSQHIVIRVRDTGIGIPEDQLPNIFDRFYQVDDSPTRQSEGSGIGLALTKELVKLMHGEIAAKSQYGKGAEFQITLPVRREAPETLAPAATGSALAGMELTAPDRHAAKASRPAPNRGNAAAPLILVAEDNPDVVAYLASCLEGHYRLLVAKDGREAIDIALETVPDLAITDVMMPYKDGFEVCRTLRHDERTSHIPIVMLTAKADLESMLDGLEYGADAYLAKPFHKDELLLRIRKLLELRQQLRQHYLAVAGLDNRSDSPPENAAAAPVVEDRFVQKVRQAVEAHLDDNRFDVEQLCREIAMSHSQLHRKLSALTGLAATRFIRQVRLNKAKELLLNPALSITAIAFDTGFNDPSYFGRVFRLEFGVSPQEWREHLN